MRRWGRVSSGMTYVHDPRDIPSAPGGTRILFPHGSVLRRAVRPINSRWISWWPFKRHFKHHGVVFEREGYPGAKFITDFSAETGIGTPIVEVFEGRFKERRTTYTEEVSDLTAFDRLNRYLGLGLDPVRDAPTFHGLLRNCECFVNRILHNEDISHQVQRVVRNVLRRMHPERAGF